jgi:hypothetical protein
VSDKFPSCNSCLHREDPVVCGDCDNADGYELDESLIEIGEDGFMRVRNELIEVPQ